MTDAVYAQKSQRTQEFMEQQLYRGASMPELRASSSSFSVNQSISTATSVVNLTKLDNASVSARLMMDPQAAIPEIRSRSNEARTQLPTAFAASVAITYEKHLGKAESLLNEAQEEFRKGNTKLATDKVNRAWGMVRTIDNAIEHTGNAAYQESLTKLLEWGQTALEYTRNTSGVVFMALGVATAAGPMIAGGSLASLGLTAETLTALGLTPSFLAGLGLSATVEMTGATQAVFVIASAAMTTAEIYSTLTKADKLAEGISGYSEATADVLKRSKNPRVKVSGYILTAISVASSAVKTEERRKVVSVIANGDVFEAITKNTNEVSKTPFTDPQTFSDGLFTSLTSSASGQQHLDALKITSEYSLAEVIEYDKHGKSKSPRPG